jgi:hypothetical protein
MEQLEIIEQFRNDNGHGEVAMQQQRVAVNAIAKVLDTFDEPRGNNARELWCANLILAQEAEQNQIDAANQRIKRCDAAAGPMSVAAKDIAARPATPASVAGTTTPDAVPAAPAPAGPLPWAVGTIVELQGLKSDAFNGLGGEVLQLDHVADRYVCRISSGHVTKIKPDNLKKLEGADAEKVKEAMKKHEQQNVPMRAARRSSYDFVVDHCLIDKDAVLQNTRKNAESMVGKEMPKVEEPPSEPRAARTLHFKDNMLDDTKFGHVLRDIVEFDLEAPITTMMGGNQDDEGMDNRSDGSDDRFSDSDYSAGDAASPVSDRSSDDRPDSAGDPYDFSYLSKA